MNGLGNGISYPPAILKPVLCLLLCLAATPLSAEEGAKITGQFIWSGDLPVRPTLERSQRISDQTWVFSPSPPVLRGWNVDRASRGVKNLYVYLAQNDGTPIRTEGKRGFTNADEFKKEFATQNGFPIEEIPQQFVSGKLKRKIRTSASLVTCYQGRFSPECLAIEEGQPVVFVNCDKIGYYLNASRRTDSEFFALPPGAVHVCLWTAGDRFDVTCGIHPWMELSVLVFPHPYFALTDDDGEFAIKQVPKGSYRLVVRQFDTFIHVRDGKAYCGKQNESMAVEIKKATSFDVSRVTVSCGR